MKQRNNNQKGPQRQAQASPFESTKSWGKDLIDSVGRDLIKGVASDAKKQIFGRGFPSYGTFRPQEAQRAAEKEKDKRPFFPERRVRRERLLYLLKEDEREIAHRIKTLTEEIRKLAKEINGLENQVPGLTQVVVKDEPAAPGIYHLNFLDWILSLVRLARQKVSDAATWLTVWQTRKAKRGLLAGFGFGRGKKSATAGVHLMLGGEMSAARSGT